MRTGIGRHSVNANKIGKFPTSMQRPKDQDQWNSKIEHYRRKRQPKMPIIAKGVAPGPMTSVLD